MEAIDVLSAISRGEDSQTQFKRNISNSESLAGELVAFSNCEGGYIFVGIDDNGSVSGVSGDDLRRINQLVSNTATDHVKPAINVTTRNIDIDGKIVLVIGVHKGLNKPYMDNSGVIWVKNGSDKRRVTAREELQRLFQSSSLIHADESISSSMTIADIDMESFRRYYETRYNESLNEQRQPLEQLISNMNLGKDGQLNLSGALLFGKNPSIYFPQYIVKAVAFPGNAVTENSYIDSKDIKGRLSDIFHQTVSFLRSNIRQIQNDQGFNSLGEDEIPPIVFEELVANALIHRDYFISSPVRVFVFNDRIEIISPGHLPNNLTVENIKMGNSNMRNPILASFAVNMLPYRGIGSGILRALEKYSDIEFIDDRAGNMFKCVIGRSVVAPI